MVRTGGLSAASDVVNVEHLVNVVILDDGFLFLDVNFTALQRERVKARAKIMIYLFVAKRKSDPVKSNLRLVAVCFGYFDIRNIVRRSVWRPTG